MSAALQEPAVARSGASIHSREEQDEEEFAKQHDENPLDVRSTSSIQPTPSVMEREDPLSNIHTPASPTEHPDEPPPPYEFINTGPPINPNAIEFSEDNSPQLVHNPHADSLSAPGAEASRSPGPGVTSLQSVGLPSISPSDASLVPAPLAYRPASTINSPSEQRVLTAQSPAPSSATGFSSAKAREAGFEIENPSSPSASFPPASPVSRADSNSSLPSLTILPSTDTLRYTREPGKAIAYVIPFPKPRLKGLNAEEIPIRFFVYTPPLPPLSKPAEGEKEGAWHKTQRQWQEDVRRATMTNASAASWKGMKAKTTILFGKGVTMSRSCNVEFLDRVSGGAVSASEAAEHADKEPQPEGPSELPAQPAGDNSHARASSISPSVSQSVSSGKSAEKDDRPKAMEELTLIYPPSLPLTPEQIRSEFMDTLMRTKSQSLKDAVIASTLVPFAATIDASLIFTLGGLTSMSSAWAYNSTRGAVASKKMAEGIALAETHVHKGETQGCTCGHHEDTFGTPETASVLSRYQSKGKKKAITLQLQPSSQIELLRRYLDLACLKTEFNHYPHITEVANDPNESAILEALGWRPVRRQGSDLELEFKGKVERLTSEQDEEYQWKEAREDVKRMFKKAAKEWAAMCSAGFEKEKKKEKSKEKKKSEWDS